MSNTMTALERAFQLAETGEYADVSSIKRQLKTERHNTNVLEGASLTKQLRAIITEARKPTCA